MTEVLEFLLYRPHQRQFDISGIPETAAPGLKAFFEASNKKLSGGVIHSGYGDDDANPNPNDDMLEEEEEEEDLDQAWFELCQDLPVGALASDSGDAAHGLEYMRITPDGALYELKPTLRLNLEVLTS